MCSHFVDRKKGYQKDIKIYQDKLVNDSEYYSHNLKCHDNHMDKLLQNSDDLSKSHDKLQIDYEKKVKEQDLIDQRQVQHDHKEYEKQLREESIASAENSGYFTEEIDKYIVYAVNLFILFMYRMSIFLKLINAFMKGLHAADNAKCIQGRHLLFNYWSRTSSRGSADE